MRSLGVALLFFALLAAACSAPPNPTPVALTPAVPLQTVIASVTSTPVAAHPTSYTVKSGDTLSAIAAAIGIPTQALIDANPAINPNVPLIGQVIKLPGVVAAGVPQTVAATVSAALSATPTLAQTSPPASAITGLGATDAVWGSLHKLVTRVPNGAQITDESVYDALPSGYGRFSIVVHVHGHIKQFILGFPGDDASIDVAKQQARTLLPSDAVLVSDEVGGACELQLYQSAALGEVFADPLLGTPGAFENGDSSKADFEVVASGHGGDPDGFVDVELLSPAQYSQFNSAHVVDVSIRPGTAEDQPPDCR